MWKFIELYRSIACFVSQFYFGSFRISILHLGVLEVSYLNSAIGGFGSWGVDTDEFGLYLLVFRAVEEFRNAFPFLDLMN